MWPALGARGLHAASNVVSPIVLLYGWLGAHASHLAKYASLYENLGASKVVSIQPTLAETAIPRWGDRVALRSVGYVVDELHSHPGPVFVHCMSNAGWIAFGSILHLSSLAGGHHQSPFSSSSANDDIVGDPRRLAILPRTSPAELQGLLEFRSALPRVAGIVIDSAPSLATPHIWAKGTVAAVLRRTVREIEQSNPTAVAIAYQAAQRYLTLPSVTRRLKEVRAAWQHDAPLAPQLYLYSKADALIPESHVQAFMAQQAHRGVAVDSHCWSDSPHCEHLRKHPEHYKRLVHSFMQRCLGQTSEAANWV